ncbi:hypothetical protein JMN32_12770 [Fulvivirga sp. 29W222]|uniref:Uncharacterized protein n=1 Tax=Fulvivirga marina TaxID=2494733 RepID=A0A937FY81_9BACT|nr:hypothetical protein [Fulvivirga marina]MBL6447187.1 hypothetical protein [Fulvivirga marina]
MGGGGALDAMNKSLKQNRAMLNSGSGFEKRKNSFYSSNKSKKWTFKKATPEQLQRINDKMVELRKADIRRKALVLVLSGLISIMLIWAALTFFGF